MKIKLEKTAHGAGLHIEVAQDAVQLALLRQLLETAARADNFHFEMEV